MDSSDLLCSENIENLVYTPSIGTTDEEFVRILFDKEMSFGFKKTESFSYTNDDDRLIIARSEAITCILKTTSTLRLKHKTAYLSVMYFDRFVSRRAIDSANIRIVRLLAMACLSIATKVEEIADLTLSVFQDGDCNLEPEMRANMERLVLTTLEWKLHLITPFDFLHFFIETICKQSSSSSSAPSVSRVNVTPFILAIMRDINLIEIRPSTVAVASILRVMDQSLNTRKEFQFRMSSVSCRQFLEMEDLFECYNLLLKLEPNHTELSIAAFDGRSRSDPK